MYSLPLSKSYNLAWAHDLIENPVPNQRSIKKKTRDVDELLRTFASKSAHAQIFLKLWLQVESDEIRLKT